MKNRYLKCSLLMLMLIIITAASGCSAVGGQASEKAGDNKTQTSDITDNAIFDLYNQIDINDKKTDIEKDLGATGNTSAEGSYFYLDPDTSYAVNVFFNSKDLVTLKVLIPTTGARELIELSDASVTKEQATKITPGMTQSNVKKVLSGQGIEVLRMAIPGGVNKEAYALAWINTDGSVLVVTFDAETNTVLAAEFKASLF